MSNKTNRADKKFRKRIKYHYELYNSKMYSLEAYLDECWIIKASCVLPNCDFQNHQSIKDALPNCLPLISGVVCVCGSQPELADDREHLMVTQCFFHHLLKTLCAFNFCEARITFIPHHYPACLKKFYDKLVIPKVLKEISIEKITGVDEELYEHEKKIVFNSSIAPVNE